MSRFPNASRWRAAAMHASASVLMGGLAAWLVFVVWYPAPFYALTGGRDLFLILVSVDVVCGPALTAVVFNPRKPRAELIRDLGFIVLVQIGALAYGLWSMYLARPLVVGFEGDRFRVVTAAELLDEEREAGQRIKPFFSGPVYVGVLLFKPGDEGYLDSVRLAIEGLHPSARPSRWLPYTQVQSRVAEAAKPLSLLASRAAAGPQSDALQQLMQAARRSPQDLAYLPLISRWATDWSVVVDRHDGSVVGIVNIDGW